MGHDALIPDSALQRTDPNSREGTSMPLAETEQSNPVGYPEWQRVSHSGRNFFSVPG